ncbi:MAG: zf-HC2 domain-containing protein [Blastocatellia bacterium]|nr:zf-HC2 domain-containing protein [Blastocatellia bacterium]
MTPNDSRPTECAAAAEWLVAFDAGELPVAQTAEIRTHVTTCPACREELAVIAQAREAAADLALASPHIDRYPEFLRRLAAEETPPQESLIPVEEQRPAPPGGLAAIVPVFGRRLFVRSGFGSGFELQLVSRDGEELLRLSTSALATRAGLRFAAASAFGGATIVALFLLLFSLASRPREAQPQDARPTRTDASASVRVGRRWMQTASSNAQTLLLWNDESGVRIAFLDANGRPSPAQLLPDAALPDAPAPGLTDCAAAIDDHGGLVLCRQGSAIRAWPVSPNRQIDEWKPVLISDRGTHPVIARSGDRYLAAWIEPDPTAPKLRFQELAPDGAPREETAAVAAVTEDGAMIGSPAIAADADRAVIFYQMRGGALAARRWNAAQGIHPAAIPLGRHPGILLHRAQLLLHDASCLIAWVDVDRGLSALRLATLTDDDQLRPTRTLASAPGTIDGFDLRLRDDRLALLWSATATDAPQRFAQTFSLDGRPLHKPLALPSSPPGPLAFADSTGAAYAVPPLAVRSIEWP